MTNRKNHNSIIFLTTLSVYLGLVLVGGAATPSVFAQAAMTQKFDVQSEIEVKDDLDKKPDENDLFAGSIVNLVQELNKFSKRKKFDWSLKGQYDIDLAFCESDNSQSSLSGGTFDRQIELEIEKSAVNTGRNLFTRVSQVGLGSIYSQSLNYKIVIDDKTLTINFNVSSLNENNPKDFQPFATELTNYLTQITSNSKAPKEKLVAENTKITFENNQVFIVTRLPRAAIDELLANKKAQ